MSRRATPRPGRSVPSTSCNAMPTRSAITCGTSNGDFRRRRTRAARPQPDCHHQLSNNSRELPENVQGGDYHRKLSGGGGPPLESSEMAKQRRLLAESSQLRTGASGHPPPRRVLERVDLRTQFPGVRGPKPDGGLCRISTDEHFSCLERCDARMNRCGLATHSGAAVDHERPHGRRSHSQELR